MKKIILPKRDNNSDTVELNDLEGWEPIFAKIKGKLTGMVVKESQGWILRLGGGSGSRGHHETLQTCLEKGLEHGYEYFVEEQA